MRHDSAVATRSEHLPVRVSRWAVGPPGVLFFLATAVALVIALDANSRGSLSGLLVAAPIWLVIAVVWLVRFAIAVRRTRLQIPPRDVARWLAIPLVMTLVLAVTRTDIVTNARFELSRDALDVMAADVMAGGSTDRGWVGLYNVGPVERTGNGFRFVIDDSWFYRVGFAYSTAGRPQLTEENYSPLWTEGRFEHIGNGWWAWWEQWD